MHVKILAVLKTALLNEGTHQPQIVKVALCDMSQCQRCITPVEVNYILGAVADVSTLSQPLLSFFCFRCGLSEDWLNHGTVPYHVCRFVLLLARLLLISCHVFSCACLSASLHMSLCLGCTGYSVVKHTRWRPVSMSEVSSSAVFHKLFSEKKKWKKWKKTLQPNSQ